MKSISGYAQFICLFCCLFGNLSFISLTLAGVKQSKPNIENIKKQPKRLCNANLEPAIAKVINRPKLARSRWGIEVQTMAGESIYSLEGDKFFNPASAAKLLVSAAGLLELGADYRLKTPLYSV